MVNGRRKRDDARSASSIPARRDSEHVVGPSSEDSTATPPVHPAEGSASQFQIESIQFSAGPLPQPETLGGYEDIVSGAADRIITMAEDQLAHRHEQDAERLGQEGTRLDADIKLEARGQWMAFVVAMTALLGGMSLLAFDTSVAGLTTTIGAVAGIIGLFISSRWQKARKPHMAPPPDEPESESSLPVVTE